MLFRNVIIFILFLSSNNFMMCQIMKRILKFDYMEIGQIYVLVIDFGVMYIVVYFFFVKINFKRLELLYYITLERFDDIKFLIILK